MLVLKLQALPPPLSKPLWRGSCGPVERQIALPTSPLFPTRTRTMDSISVFLIAFGAGCLTGLVVHVWMRQRRRRVSEHTGTVRTI
jgi:hypothetical protein